MLSKNALKGLQMLSKGPSKYFEKPFKGFKIPQKHKCSHLEFRVTSYVPR